MQYPVDRHGLIHTARSIAEGLTFRTLARDVAAGRLVKLRAGRYVDGEHWAALDGVGRHRLAMRAALSASSSPLAFGGASAAALHGIPVPSRAGDVVVVDRWRGGGRSSPGIRRTAADQRTAEFVEIDGMRCTTLARTVVDLARSLPFPDAVAAADAALWRRRPERTTDDALQAELGKLTVQAPRQRVSAVLAFATHLADSVGESKTRVAIDRLGFAPPVLQQPFEDAQGSMETDFYWPSVRVVVEFDGRIKYTRDEFTGGDPAGVVWREKQRQDRLVRLVAKVERVIWREVQSPALLDALLRGAGVPRAGARR